jgi:hypothetical protein
VNGIAFEFAMPDITTASMRAIVSAMNRAVELG